MNQLCFLSVGYCKTSELRPKTHKHDRNKTISHLENKSTIETERKCFCSGTYLVRNSVYCQRTRFYRTHGPGFPDKLITDLYALAFFSGKM